MSNQQTETVYVDCSDCRHTVKISKEEYDKTFNVGPGWVLYCSKCEYKHKKLIEEIKKLNGLTLRPSKFELGKFHIFYKFGKRYECDTNHSVPDNNKHFIIDIIKITDCFITYKIRNYGEGEWTKCKRKRWNPIDRRLGKWHHTIKYPKEWSVGDWEQISPDDLYRKCD
tara:strand:+ start:662 stop:1168 length:507 start_codon:yes stop_codon:yes gene_type:complete